MRLQGMDLNSFFLDTIGRKTIKVMPMPAIKTPFLAMALLKNYLDLLIKLIISHIVKPVSWSWNFHGRKFSKFFVCSIIKTVAPAPFI